MNTTAPPLVSVVMPVFNAERYVEEAARSILSQSFSAFELIAIDDGSTDGSKEVLEKLKASDSRITLISRENRGLVDSLNEGIERARGAWIARMDADDISLPHRFEQQLKWLEDSGADICGTWIQQFGTPDTRIMKYPYSDSGIKAAMLFAPPFAHPTVMMRTEIAKLLKYDKKWENVEDYHLWERAAANQYQMANVSQALVRYRQHPKQISAIARSRQQEMAQQIRFRIAGEFSRRLQLDSTALAQLIGLRGDNIAGVDMELADQGAESLLENATDEAQEVLWDHLARLYFRAAGVHPNTTARWRNLCDRFDHVPSLQTQIAIWLAQLFGIKVDGVIFNALKVHYKGF